MRSLPSLRLRSRTASAPGLIHTSGPLDRLFLKCGTAAGFILDFDGPLPDLTHLASRVLQRAARLPALNLLAPASGRQRWRPAAGPLAAAVHLRDIAAPPGELDAATSSLLRCSLPEGPHPPWDVSLLRDPASRHFRICYRVHHGVQDGAGAAHAVLALLGDEALAGPYPYRSAAPTPRGALLAARGLRSTAHPKKDWAALHDRPAQQTRWSYQDVPEARLREVATVHGVTINDLCLAALAQALRGWRRTGLGLDGPCPDLRALVPMSLREEHERHAPGNRLGGHRLSLPCSASDLGEALRRVQRQTGVVRTARVGDVFRLAMRALPPWLGEHVSSGFTAKRPAPIVATGVALPASMTCLGARLRAASMFGDLYNERLCYVSFTRAAGVVRCGVLYDSALPQAASLAQLWAEVLLRRGT
ncbi:hypothetical protein [Streptomyces altiplanensis]